MAVLCHKLPRFPDTGKRNALARPHDPHHQQGKSEIPLLHAAEDIAQRRSNGYNTRHHKEQAHIGTNSRHRTNLLSFFLLQAQRGQHGPIGNVVSGIGKPPGYINQGKHRHIPRPPKPEIGEKQHGQHPGKQRSQGYPWLELSEPGAGIIHHHPHDRVIERIKNTGTKNNDRYPPQSGCGQFYNVRKIINQVHAHHGIDHIPAYRA